MPRKANGHQEPEPNPDFEMMTHILNDLRHFWATECNSSGVDPVRFGRLGIVALTQWTAIVGVDLGMQEEQFMAVCRANFQEAFKRAPRFG